MKKILGIGNSLVDLIVFLKNDDLLDTLSLPKGSMQLVDARLSETIEKLTFGMEHHRASGGSTANTVHGLAKLGVKTGFIGAVGKDVLAGFFRNDMQLAGIETFLSENEMPTGMAISLVSTDGERTFATHLGAAVSLQAENLDRKIFKEFDHLHLEGYLVQDHDFTTHVLHLARETGMTVSLDLASYNVVETHLPYLKEILSDRVHILFANESEARSFTQIEDPEAALEHLGEYCDIAVVKTGENGSLIRQQGQIYRVNAISANCIDTTGAGDLYASGFLYGMTRDWDPENCGKTGSLLAGKVIEEAGAKIGPDGWSEIFSKLNDRP